MAQKIREAMRRVLTVRSHVRVTTHETRPSKWVGPDMTIAILADFHVVAPWTTLQDVARIVDLVNRMDPDLIVLAGDYLADVALPGNGESASAIVDAVAGLKAKLGTFAILGNHDWQDCPLAKSTNFERNSVVEAFETSDITLLQNASVRSEIDGHEFWLVGFDSQRPHRFDWSKGFHRPDEAFSGVPKDASAILLAHEPDYFDVGDGRSLLQISGHTHGGQLNLFGWRPMTPSQFGGKYAYGHKLDGDRNLIVSGGIGFSGIPMRIGQPPEITIVKIRGSIS